MTKCATYLNIPKLCILPTAIREHCIGLRHGENQIALQVRARKYSQSTFVTAISPCLIVAMAVKYKSQLQYRYR